jgi:hypothetical protein
MNILEIDYEDIIVHVNVRREVWQDQFSDIDFLRYNLLIYCKEHDIKFTQDSLTQAVKILLELNPEIKRYMDVKE